MKNRVIFVGLHNKPHVAPLDSHTKTGKLVDRIIAELPKDFEIIKSNIFNLDYYPMDSVVFDEVDKWYWTYLPIIGDIVVLLGQATHLAYKNISYRETWSIIKVAHPASKWNHRDMNEYIKDVSTKIREQK